jgi:hypothetical protein
MKAKKEEQLIKRELAKLGAAGGAAGGVIGGVLGSIGGGIGGAAGAAWAQQYLPTIEVEQRFRAAVEPETVLKAAFDAMQKVGKIVEPDSEEDNAGLPTILAIVGAGFLNLNPAVVQFVIVAGEENQTEFQISAFAKEGLIKQKTSQKAIVRVLDAAADTLGRLTEIPISNPSG